MSVLTNDEKVFYNSLVKRLKDAEKYMDDDSIALEKREKWIPKLQELRRDMHDISKANGLTNKEMMEGFEI